MTEADVWGSESHGIFRLPHYIRRHPAGGVNLPRIRVTQERPATALVDGDNAMGHLVMRAFAIEKARGTGVAWVGVRMSNHAEAGVAYARMPAAEGMVGMYFCVGNANHLAPWGGLDMLLSTNPIAFAVPGLEEPAVVLDMATTVSSFGKIKVYAQQGEDACRLGDRARRRPLTDAKRAAEGTCCRSAAWRPGTRATGSRSYSASSPVRSTPRWAAKSSISPRTTPRSRTPGTRSSRSTRRRSATRRRSGGRVDRVVRELHASERMPGVERILMPGERSHEKRKARAASGIPMSPPLRASLDKLAGELKIAAPRLAGEELHG